MDFKLPNLSLPELKILLPELLVPGFREVDLAFPELKPLLLELPDMNFEFLEVTLPKVDTPAIMNPFGECIFPDMVLPDVDPCSEMMSFVCESLEDLFGGLLEIILLFGEIGMICEKAHEDKKKKEEAASRASPEEIPVEKAPALTTDPQGSKI